jgi:hypothetical protein
MDLFRARIVCSPIHPIQPQILHSFLRLIQVERTSHPVDTNMMRGIVGMFHRLQDEAGSGSMYDVVLEKRILEETKLFYEQEAKHWLETQGGCDVPAFLIHASVIIYYHCIYICKYMYIFLILD